jgi:tetratricopeptide (TPR) repeat protein/DNA-binding SARP family transcriptional activator
MLREEHWPGGWQARQQSDRQRKDLAHLLPAGWPQDVPLVRVRTCGCAPLRLDVLCDFEQPASFVGPVYGLPDEATWQATATTTTLALLAYLASQPHCYASQDALAQALRPGRQHMSEEEDEDAADAALKRPENVVSLLRRLLFPPALRSLPEASQRVLRHLLVRRVKASQESGPGYILAPSPLLWLDVEAMEAHCKQARTLEQFGESGLSEWQQASLIGLQGVFLPHEPYSEWATWRRGRVKELLWQSVEAQLQALAQGDEQQRGTDASLSLLTSYWQVDETNEDAFRLLAEHLGKLERFQQTEECYQQLCLALERAGREPHERTEQVMEFVRTRQIQRQSTIAQKSMQHYPSPLRESLPEGVSLENLLELSPFLEVFTSSFKQDDDALVKSRALQMPLHTTLLALDTLEGTSGSQEHRLLARRHILTALAALPLSVPWHDISTLHASLIHAFLAQCASSLVACNHLLKSQDFWYAKHILTHIIPPLDQIMHQPASPGAFAAHLLAQAYMFLGILESHQLNWTAYQSCNEKAVQMSLLTSDASLQVIASVQLAMAFFQFERPSQALSCYRQMESRLKESSPLVQSNFSIKRALAYAQAGQAMAAHRCIEQAYAHFPTHPEKDTSSYLTDFGCSSLLSWHATAEFQLAQQLGGDVQKVWSTLSQVDQLASQKSAKVSAYAQILRAETAVTMNDLEQFTHFLTAGVLHAKTLKSARRFQEAVVCYQRARATWPQEAQLLPLADLMLAGAFSKKDQEA